MSDKTASELARETLKQLAARKLPPTPVNYQAVFNEIGGLLNEPAFPVEQLRRLAKDLPARTPGQQKQRNLLEFAISQLSWDGVRNALVAYGGFSPRNGSDAPATSGPMGATDPLPQPEVTVSSPSAPALTADFLEQIARLIEFARPALGTDDARFTEQTQEMLRTMRQPGVNVVQVKQMLSTFGHRVSFAAEDRPRSRPPCCICCA